MHNDKAHQKAAKGSSGVVGESHIWDGPLRSRQDDYTDKDQVQVLQGCKF